MYVSSISQSEQVDMKETEVEMEERKKTNPEKQDDQAQDGYNNICFLERLIYMYLFACHQNFGHAYTCICVMLWQKRA